MDLKELDSLLMNAIEKKSKSVELYQNIAGNTDDDEMQSMIAQNIVATEKKHEALLKKIMEQYSRPDVVSSPDIREDGMDLRSERIRIGAERLKSNLATREIIEQLVNKKDMKKIILHPSMDCYVSQYYADRNFAANTALFVGRYLRPGDSYRSLLKFDFMDLPAGAQILKAGLILDIGRNEVKEDNGPVHIFRIGQDWNASQITWNSQPELAEKIMGTASINYGRSGSIAINITELVNGWYRGDYSNHGVLVMGGESSNSLIAFSSSNFEDKEKWPVLKIEYKN